MQIEYHTATIKMWAVSNLNSHGASSWRFTR